MNTTATSALGRSWAAMMVGVLVLLASGCGLLERPLGVEEANQHYAGLTDAMREVLGSEYDGIPPANESRIPYSGRVDDCIWYPGSITVPDDFGPTMRDDVAMMVQPVLTEYGFDTLHDADHDGVVPYLIATDAHGAEISVFRRGDVSIGIEIPVDTDGRNCDAASLS